jgi:hypothetical protein
VIWNTEEGFKRSAADIAKAENLRTAMYHRMRVFLEKYDFFVCPVNQLPPFPVDQDYPREIAGVKMTNYLDWMKSCYYITLTTHPAISVPAGFTDDGLPVGIQIVGRYRDDFGLLQFAHAFEQVTEVWKRRPRSRHSMALSIAALGARIIRAGSSSARATRPSTRPRSATRSTRAPGSACWRTTGSGDSARTSTASWSASRTILFHTGTWNNEVCYLQDLFVDPRVRGRGVARALIEAVATGRENAARGEALTGLPRSQCDARALYDKVAKYNDFIRYDYPL